MELSESKHKCGLAVLVGAGPGDPALITLAGAGWLRRAQCVIYDRLANPVLLDHAPADAERIYVGKQTDRHEMTQDRINQLLVEKCLEGKLVVRLKGGDPFIFGRGGEEIDALHRAGVKFRIVPGVTAGIAAGAYAGIPLTDRRAAQTVTLITGHEDPTKDDSAIDWASLARLDTLVFYMGVAQLPEIADRLQAAGMSGGTPVAVIRRATTPAQKTVTGTLATIADDVRQAGLTPPAIIIVGLVAAAGEQMAWYENLPLAGQTIIVTR
ncbi:MAG: uroporphyrinogen-III C-methyltransferase, partial [Planctomycetaceae bacterium]